MMQTPYYIFYADEFKENYLKLQKAFREIYPNYRIAYSFKTNYTPAVCKAVLDLGGYAEVVSDMEYELAKRIGFASDRIVYNGPGKGPFMESCVIEGGLLNLDNLYEVDQICNMDCKNISVGLRVNFDIGNGLHSRFGLDITNGDLDHAVEKLHNRGIRIRGLHFHISRARGLDSWNARIENMLKVADRFSDPDDPCYQDAPLEYIDLGSGMFGQLDDELKTQFGCVPSYSEYAQIVAGKMRAHYPEEAYRPMLITEPGTTLVSKYFHLFARVIDIKNIREKAFALLDCSFHNVGEICGLKKVPFRVLTDNQDATSYEAIDLVGYTCLEQDVISRNYSGRLAAGDVLEFYNGGGYSIVDKPPFIHPDIPIYMIKNGTSVCVKRAQTIDDIFAPYSFDLERE